ncbi:hypothetical protein P4493_05070 [Bacillus thuringiensis]|uniref:Membrane protein n=1 Tax=Bacillus thuringiensis TaxID=1428 RepID=A0A0B5NKT8_BACTU|nr:MULTISPECIES: hypothetical protein [Bacillus]MEC2535603.1 hypothetical protein [Bacillus cereus]MED1153634.1 hypothetical protein [Bacillus paranthracis]AJG74007.1 putative membrane protein [Bacillus thuringiensis]AJH02897.1 putative membrane protein [Bacillus thuringiensis HD1002]EEM74186.1 hypothetical protein bthur0010_58460 [Bacillus thuringiensis serovar pondicheriensis BGSC 4BA1]
MNERGKLACLITGVFALGHIFSYWLIGSLNIISFILSLLGGVAGFWVLARLEGVI